MLKINVKDWAELPVLMTTRDVEDLLGLCEKTVLKYARDGIIPAKKLGTGEWVFSRAQFQEYFEN